MSKRSKWDAAPTKAELTKVPSLAGGPKTKTIELPAASDTDPDTSHLSIANYANLSPDPEDKVRVEKWIWAG